MLSIRYKLSRPVNMSTKRHFIEEPSIMDTVLNIITVNQDRAMRIIQIIPPMFLLLGACATGVDSISHRNPHGTTQSNTYSVNYGKIVDIKSVNLEGYHDGLGTYGGGIVGHEVGRTLGGGSGSGVAGAVVGVAGAIAGRAVQKKATSQQGVELTIEYENGDVIAVVQPKADKPLQLDDPVRVLVPRNGPARVERR